jgi:signal transduction histidine kinase
VQDEGPGFNEFDKKNLYQKFKKLTARPTAGESSNGLGLAIVKTLVDRLNGQIELISEVGKGSKFIVRLPIV